MMHSWSEAASVSRYLIRTAHKEKPNQSITSSINEPFLKAPDWWWTPTWGGTFSFVFLFFIAAYCFWSSVTFRTANTMTPRCEPSGLLCQWGPGMKMISFRKHSSDRLSLCSYSDGPSVVRRHDWLIGQITNYWSVRVTVRMTSGPAAWCFPL